ncbi:MAG: HD domain-containing protein [Candidatus Paceibacterota bacterium]
MTKNSSKDQAKLFRFLDKIENLKSTLRYVSLKSGRKESSAEHSWRLSLMAFLAAEELKLDIDTDRAVKIALVHDIAESITGDIDAIKIKNGEITKESKNKLEARAMENLRNLAPKKTGSHVYGLWEEYESGKTKEAKYIKALDKLETLLQLSETGHKIYDDPEFMVHYADKAISNFPELKNMLIEIKKNLKREFKKGNILWKKEYDDLN